MELIMMNTYEYRLNRLKNVLFEAESTLEANRSNLDDETIKQRELFIKKLKDEREALLKELGVNTKSQKKSSDTDDTTKADKKADKSKSKSKAKKEDDKK